MINKIVDQFKKVHHDNIHLYTTAFRHESIKGPSYQRLEFLGDSVIHLSLANYLFNRYNDQDRGFLTKLRIKLENCNSLAHLTKELGLDKFLQIDGVQITDSILEDIMESFIGALYLNCSYEDTSFIFIKIIEKYKDISQILYHDDNYKDILLRYFHHNEWGHPIYKDLYDKTTSDKHKVGVYKGAELLCTDIGIVKKNVEQAVSKKALEHYGIIIDGIIEPDWYEKLKVDAEIEEDSIPKISATTRSRYNPQNILFTKWTLYRLLGTYGLRLRNFNITYPSLYAECFTHRSYLIRSLEMTELDKLEEIRSVAFQPKSYERLVFLGNAVIHFILSCYLYDKYSKEREGFLSRLRIKLENKDTLFFLAKQTKLYKYVLFSSKIEEDMDGRNNVNIVSSIFESFFGALYLDQGINICRTLLIAIIEKELDVESMGSCETNYKDLLIALYKKQGWHGPIYKLENIEGPDHRKMFTMLVAHPITGEFLTRATCSSQKGAERKVAKLAYELLTE